MAQSAMVVSVKDATAVIFERHCVGPAVFEEVEVREDWMSVLFVTMLDEGESRDPQERGCKTGKG